MLVGGGRVERKCLCPLRTLLPESEPERALSPAWAHHRLDLRAGRQNDPQRQGGGCTAEGSVREKMSDLRRPVKRILIEGKRWGSSPRRLAGLHSAYTIIIKGS
eukprot:1369338-Rhodomonas_salina.2